MNLAEIPKPKITKAFSLRVALLSRCLANSFTISFMSVNIVEEFASENYGTADKVVIKTG